MADLNLALKIQALVKGAKDIDDLSDKLDDLIKQGKQQLPDNTEELRQGAELAKQGLESLRNTIIGLATAFGAGLLGQSVIEIGSKFEKLNAQLTTLEGGSQAAQNSMAWITEFAAKTPYTLDQVAEAFVKLRAYGINPTDGALKTLGDTAAAMGKPIEDAVEALADAVTGENERLKEFGITARVEGEKIVYTYVKAGEQMTATADKNSRAMIQSTLLAIWNDKYQGQMDVMSKTFEGLTSNLSDQWLQFANSIAQSGLFDALKAEITKVLADIQRLSNDGTLQAWARDIGQTLGGLVTALADFARTLVSHKELILTVAQALGVFAIANSNLAKSALDLAGSLTKSVGAVQTFGTALKAISPLNKIAIVITGLELLTKATEGLAELAARFSDVDKAVAESAKKVREAMQAEADALYQRAMGLSEYAKTKKLTADQVAQLNEQERASYAKNLEGLREYELALFGVAIREGNTEAQKTHIAALNQVRQAYADLEAGVKLSAEAQEKNVSLATLGIIKQFDVLIAKGSQTNEALAQIGKNVDWTRAVDVAPILQALNRLQTEGKVTSDQISQNLASALDKLSTQELTKFQIAAESAFGGVKDQINVLALATDAVAGAALRKLGLDASSVLEGIGNQSKIAVGAFDLLAQQATLTGAQLQTAFTAALSKIEDQVGLERLRASLIAAGDAGKLAGELVTNGLAKIDAQLRTLAGASDPVVQAFKTLGIASSESLKQAADTAQQAFDTLKKGGATVGELNAAYAVLAEKVLSAANAQGATALQIATYQLQAKAATEEQVQALQDLISRYQTLDTTVQQTASEQVATAEQVTQAINNQADAIANIEHSMAGVQLATIQYGSQVAAAFDTRGIIRYQAILQTIADDTNKASEAAERLQDAIAGSGGNLAVEIGKAEALARELAAQIGDGGAGMENLVQQTEVLRDRIEEAKDAMREFAEEQEKANQEEALSEELAAAQGNARRVAEIEYREQLAELNDLLRQAEEQSNQRAIDAINDRIERARRQHQERLRQIADEEEAETASQSRQRQTKPVKPPPVDNTPVKPTTPTETTGRNNIITFNISTLDTGDMSKVVRDKVIPEINKIIRLST